MTEIIMNTLRPTRNARNLRLKDGKWYIDFTYKGKRIRKFGGFTKDQARITLARMRIEKLDETLGVRKPAAEPIVFEKFAAAFLETYCKQNKRSWGRDEISLGNLKRFFKGEILQDIGPEQLERFKAERKLEVSPSTVNRELACFKTMFNKAVEWGKLESNPIRAVKKFKENNPRERILTTEEARRLIDAAAPAIRPVLIIALNTGMRRNEILKLNWANVDFHRGYINIEDSKSGKPRKIPMNGSVSSALMGLPHVADFVFFNPETKTHVYDHLYFPKMIKADYPG